MNEFLNIYKNKITLKPTSYSPALIEYAKAALNQIYCEKSAYRKCGVILGGLISEKCYQPDLFSKANMGEDHKKMMNLIDSINGSYKKKAIQFAAEGFAKPWQMKQNDKSPRYTTKWDEILIISN